MLASRGSNSKSISAYSNEFRERLIILLLDVKRVAFVDAVNTIKLALKISVYFVWPQFKRLWTFLKVNR